MPKVRIINFEKNLNEAMNRLGFNMVNELKKKLTKEHGKDTGLLQSSIKYEVEENSIVISMPIVGAYLEYGTAPHMPPVEALEGWAARKLGGKEHAWALAMHIKKYGTRPFPFLRVTFDQEFTRLLRKALKDSFK